MDRETLARLEHLNMVEAIIAAGEQASGARVQRTDGVALIATGLPLRLFNQVLVEDDSATPAAVAAAVAVTQARGDSFVVNLRSGTDDRFVPLMAQLGLVPVAARPWMPGMALSPLPASSSLAPPPGLEIRRVSGGAGLADHVRTAAAGFGIPVEWLQAVMRLPLAARPDVALYVGYRGGVPVTSGFGLRTGRTIGVYNIATVEGARRLGYGAAMTMRVVDDGAAGGCDVAVLQSSEMGFPIYERLGFRTVVEYVGYVDPASLTPASTG